MKILLFGGTREGRELGRFLAGEGHEVTVCVATPFGEELLEDAGKLTVLTGRKDARQIEELLQGFDLCVDATHPFAREISGIILQICKKKRIPRKRILRRESRVPKGCLAFADLAEAARYLSGRKGNILLTTGSKDIGCFAGIDPERLFVRILPCAESLYRCGEAGIRNRNIIAMFGPFSVELNLALLRQYRIAYLVTKDSGREGGLEEKLQAACRAGTKVCLIRRPEETGLTAEEFMEWMRRSNP